MAIVTLNTSPPDVKPYVPDIYLAVLNVKRDGAQYLDLRIPMPENFSFTLSSNYDHPMDQPLSNLHEGGGAVTEIVKHGTKMISGQTTMHKYLSGAVWVGGSRIAIDLPFELHAHENTSTDVMDKLAQLMTLAVPSEDGPGGFLRAPGPTVGNIEALLAGNFSGTLDWGGDYITVNLGKFITLEPCIVTSVVPSFDTQFDERGIPISVKVNVSIESYFTTTKEDLIKSFKYGISQGFTP